MMPPLEILIDKHGTIYRADEITAAVERANKAFREFAATFSPHVTAAAAKLTAIFGQVAAVLAEEQGKTEWAYRRYAAQYNAFHPTRKISWRRLNRYQRLSATLRAASDILAAARAEPTP